MQKTWHPTNNESSLGNPGEITKTIISAGNITNGLPVAVFAGQPVPDEGLCIDPPGGGALIVWPDGRFVFEMPEAEASVNQQVGMNLYYSYLMEDIDGSLTPGSVTIRAQEPEITDSSQAWSIHDMLDMETSLTSIFESNSEQEPYQELTHTESAYSSFSETDLLDYLFKASHQG